MANKPMDDREISSLVAGEVRSAIGYLGGELSEQRREALELYYGEKAGELAVDDPNRSSVVMRDVADTIEWIMPALMKIFTSGDDVVRFEPQGPEDEEAAKQATEYCNWVFNKDNNGFLVLYSMFKDALLQKNGIVKIWWEEKEEDQERTVYDLDDDAYRILLSDPDIEIIAHTEIPASVLPTGGVAGGVEPGPASPLASPPAPTHDVQYKRSRKKGWACVEPIPPEEFLIARRAKDIVSSPYTGHRTRKLLSDLIAEGYDKDSVMELSGEDEADLTEEQTERWDFDDTDDPADVSERKGVMREVWVYESYVRVDYDGDGIAELRKIVTAGSGHKMLKRDGKPANEPWDGPPPFESVTPIIQPHKFFGMSIPDVIKDLQVIKSVVMRQTLDNLYLSNNPRNLISDKVNIDDYLTPRPGGAVRVEGMPGDGHMVPFTVPFVAGHSFTMLEYLDTVKENRTGVTRYNQGIDANSLNKTASGISQITQAAQQRIELIARIFAETGVKGIFKQILRLVTKYQDKPRMIRLRNQWTPIDPSEWENEFDLTINVGLGTGNRDQQLMHLNNLLGIQMQAVQFQQGIQGPFVTGENLYNTVAKLVENMGLKSPELFFTDPAQNPMPPQPPQPDPEILKLKQEGEIKSAQLQQEGHFKEKELQLKTAEVQANIQLEQLKAGATLQLQQQKQQADHAMQQERQQGDMQLKREVAVTKAQPQPQIHVGSDGKAVEIINGADKMSEAASSLLQFMQTFIESQAKRDQMQDQQLTALMQMMTAPKEIVRDETGKALGVRTVLQ